MAEQEINTMIIGQKYKFRHDAPEILRNREFILFEYNSHWVNDYPGSRILFLDESISRVIGTEYLNRWVLPLEYKPQADSKLIFKFL